MACPRPAGRWRPCKLPDIDTNVVLVVVMRASEALRVTCSRVAPGEPGGGLTVASCPTMGLPVMAAAEGEAAR